MCNAHCFTRCGLPHRSRRQCALLTRSGLPRSSRRQCASWRGIGAEASWRTLSAAEAHLGAIWRSESSAGLEARLAPSAEPELEIVFFNEQIDAKIMRSTKGRLLAKHTTPLLSTGVMPSGGYGGSLVPPQVRAVGQTVTYSPGIGRVYHATDLRTINVYRSQE